jgi:hypothetical protein
MIFLRCIAVVLTLVCASRAIAQPSAADAFIELRLEGRDARQTSGIVLLSWGAASAIGGGLGAVFARDDEAWLAAGIAAASFGLVNALLALPLLDFTGAKRRALLQLPAADERTLQRLREEQLVAELESGQFYAINFGLDVAYITAGALLFVIGRQAASEPKWAQGAGLSVIVQGAFLLAFDLVSWLAANRRADAFRQF